MNSSKVHKAGRWAVNENFLLLSSVLPDTKGASIFVAMMCILEKHIFGAPVTTWVAMLEAAAFCCVMAFIVDSATAKVKALKLFRVYLQIPCVWTTR